MKQLYIFHFVVLRYLDLLFSSYKDGWQALIDIILYNNIQYC